MTVTIFPNTMSAVNCLALLPNAWRLSGCVDAVQTNLDLRPLMKNLDGIPVADPDDLGLIWLNCKGSRCQQHYGKDDRQLYWIVSVHFGDNATETG